MSTLLPTDFRARLKAALLQTDPAGRLAALREMAAGVLGHLETIQLERALAGVTTETLDAAMPRVRLALLSSSTTEHLLPGLRVAGLRHGLHLEVFTGRYGQYRQELLNPPERLRAFAPTAVLLSLSARPLVGTVPLDADEAEVEGRLAAEVDELRSLWRAARGLGAGVLQQTFLDVFEPLFGSLDRSVPAAPARLVERLNDLTARAAREEGVALVDVARAAAREGLDAWYDPARWLQGKMEIAPQAGGRFGELVARLAAAQQGRSRKCVVFDLDNTLWGGVVGDVGVQGLALGEGSAAGEAHLELQRYARRLKERGIVLAVCSKNDPAIAADAFRRHPEMALKLEDIACFVANWNDKAENLREIARTLNIGLDSLVFVDDNPAERARVREALPMVAVPELPDDPSLYVRALAAPGYFEAVAFTREDSQRAASYAANAQRGGLREAATSMDDFLRGLEMTVVHGPVGALELERSTQLINKTNQFNTTGRRYAADEVARLVTDPTGLSLQLRLTDRFGDNGLVSVMLLRAAGTDVLDIEIWVMSCRVFGRQLEDEAMNIAVELARARGARALTARFVPTDRNGVVAGLYAGLGFVHAGDEDQAQHWRLDLAGYEPRPTHIRRQGPTP
ncbi:MAG: HAD-IIIC family phosphatase [Rubrivivax sp.]